ncbi:alpha-L-arabinofuranosidase C-terminal domain-containing protein [Thermosulfurimonas dismutans]|uniref:non-reducing end alpha-L-arabinofuranosidase n=1 Tax=Thermosulfurimonas dismutans TaxID=999894 RepID=A0A179D2I5_9BACT|nr:alpha-L-arabinofuranosidase C-terminal domain-containing protein [Thermosulfurimonas dismutans]OAQ19848.1 Alpha-N-arabinofuranosidase [Thermosulfurimonas dismutans]
MRIFWLLVLLCFFSVSPLLAQPAAEITINFEEVERVNPYIFGQGILGFDPCKTRRKNRKFCVNDGRFTNFGAGVWDPLLRRPNAVLVDLAKRIKVSVLRFPGGCGTHHYDWKRAIGPVEKRPMYRFGIDEFMELCQAVGAKPIIVLSYFTGTCQNLADLVEYLNAPLGTNPNGGVAWAEVRAANGHPEPYGVRWFEFGNEVWHGDHRKISAVDPREYGERYLECQKLIKNIDPKIKLGAVMRRSLYGLGWWSRTVLSVIKENVDFVIFHIYPPGYRSDRNEISTNELFKIALAAPEQISDSLFRISKQLKEITRREIPIAITEYNGGFVQNKPVPYRHSLGNALLIADLLRVFLTANTPILCANYHHFSNSYWGLVYNPRYLKLRDRYYMRPNYYVFELYANHFGDILLKTKVKSKSYFQSGYKNILPSIKTKKVSSQNLNFSEIYKEKVLRIDFKWLPPCVKVKKYSDYSVIHFDCEKRNKLGIYFIDKIQNVKPNWLYFWETEIKTNLAKAWFFIAIKDQRYRRIKHSKILWGNTEWIKTGFDFKTPDNIKILNLLFFIKGKENKGIKGTVYIKNMKIGELGSAPQYGPTPYISALASTNEKRNRIYLMVINKNLEEPMRTRIKINGFPSGPVVRAWVLNGPSVTATNENRQERVKIHYQEVEVDPGKEYFWFTFEPHSVTALELTRREGT